MGRFILSKTDEWDLADEDQDIRGWKVVDATGDEVGRVDDLIADTDSMRVETIRLDNGEEFAAKDIEIGDRVVYLDRDVEEEITPVVKTYTGTVIQRRTT